MPLPSAFLKKIKKKEFLNSSIVIRRSFAFYKLRMARVSFSIKLAAPATGGWGLTPET